MKLLFCFVFFAVFLLSYPTSNYYTDSSFPCFLIYLLYSILIVYDVKINQMYLLRFKSFSASLLYYLKKRFFHTFIYFSVINLIISVITFYHQTSFSTIQYYRFLIFNLINFMILSIFHYLWACKQGVVKATIKYIFIIVLLFIFPFIYDSFASYSILNFGFLKINVGHIIFIYALCICLIFLNLKQIKRSEVLS